VGVAMAAAGAVFRLDLRRTAAAVQDAQLRQLLVAGERAAREALPVAGAGAGAVAESESPRRAPAGAGRPRRGVSGALRPREKRRRSLRHRRGRARGKGHESNPPLRARPRRLAAGVGRGELAPCNVRRFRC
jgi:hypothetical protein